MGKMCLVSCVIMVVFGFAFLFTALVGYDPNKEGGLIAVVVFGSGAVVSMFLTLFFAIRFRVHGWTGMWRRGFDSTNSWLRKRGGWIAWSSAMCWFAIVVLGFPIVFVWSIQAGWVPLVVFVSVMFCCCLWNIGLFVYHEAFLTIDEDGDGDGDGDEDSTAEKGGQTA